MLISFAKRHKCLEYLDPFGKKEMMKKINFMKELEPLEQKWLAKAVVDIILADGIVEEKNLVFDIEEFMRRPEEFKLILFTGGEDVSPSLYGHTSPKHLCGYNSLRDAMEMPIFETAVSYGIPMTGICRGSQFLNVLCGGGLLHHITNHGYNHTIATTTTNELLDVTSTHHQMSIPGPKGHIVAWSAEKRSTVYIGDKDEEVQYNGPEVEGIYYPEFKVFAVQYHPEYMNKKSKGYKTCL